MYLIFVIPFLCGLMAFASKITKKIVPLFSRDSPEVQVLRSEIAALRADLSQISMRDEYIKYVKCERAVVAMETKLNEAKGRDNVKRVMYEYGIHYGSMTVLALVLMSISFSYRYASIIVFGDNFNFDPFGRLINFPTKVPNSISVVFWIVVNNFVARTVAGYVK
ncbi:guided entry of tail-anchored proteins factor 1-like [Anopheles bellator]|uniref:guided entry of tail-anchored proteins factor 1-like n=1 Tax=Anopheles bellator TaxID=139047 RepID=UPI00264746E9|nr:guided entry of tail-anchored proteins factor 1-like [Anopheles bellator]